MCLQNLDLARNSFIVDPVGAMNALLHLTRLEELRLADCQLTGEAISQIRPGHWPRLQKLNIDGNDLSDNPIEAAQALLHLPSSTKVSLKICSLSEDAKDMTRRQRPGWEIY